MARLLFGCRRGGNNGEDSQCGLRQKRSWILVPSVHIHQARHEATEREWLGLGRRVQQKRPAKEKRVVLSAERRATHLERIIAAICRGTIKALTDELRKASEAD